jgi:hypothetical protein
LALASLHRQPALCRLLSFQSLNPKLSSEDECACPVIWFTALNGTDQEEYNEKKRFDRKTKELVNVDGLPGQ